MLINLHGKLAELFGPQHRIEAASIREALVSLSQQLKMFQDTPINNRPLIRVAGCASEEDLESRPDEINLVIGMVGGSGIAKIVVGSLLIVAGVFIPGAQFLIGTGIGLVLSGVSQLFIKAPSLSGSEDPDASEYLGIGNNTTRLGTLRSYSMGRVKVNAPHVIAVNIDSNNIVKGEFPA